MQKLCRQAHNSYIQKLVDPETGNETKKLWSYIKNQKMDYCGVPPLLHNDTLITDSYSKANILNDYFSLVFVQEDLDTFPDITRTTSNVNSQHQGTPPPTIYTNSPQPSRMNPITICSNGILKLLNNLKPGKANHSKIEKLY